MALERPGCAKTQPKPKGKLSLLIHDQLWLLLHLLSQKRKRSLQNQTRSTKSKHTFLIY